MHRANSPIVFLPGYGEDPAMCQPFRRALEEVTARPVIVGDYYDETVRRAAPIEMGSPSRILAQRVLAQLEERGAGLGDVVTHSYGAMIGDRLIGEMEDDARMALLAPAGLGGIDYALPARFVAGMTKELLKHPEALKFSLRGMANVLRCPVKSSIEAVELSHAAGWKHVRSLGERALVITYASDPVFSDEKIAQVLLAEPESEIRIVSPLVRSANHSSPFEEPEATAILVAQHLQP